MCLDPTLNHLQEKQGVDVATHATINTGQGTWPELQQQLKGLAEAIGKLENRIFAGTATSKAHVDQSFGLQAGDFQGPTLEASAGNLRRTPPLPNDATLSADNKVENKPHVSGA